MKVIESNNVIATTMGILASIAGAYTISVGVEMFPISAIAASIVVVAGLALAVLGLFVFITGENYYYRT